MSNFYNVVVDAVANVYGNKGRTHETAEVTVTATMLNGSILVNGIEIAAAASATGNQVIDETNFNGQDYAVGEKVLVSVAVRDVTVDASKLKFSDAAYDDETVTALVAAGFVFK